MLKSGVLRSLVCVGLGAMLGLIAASGNFHLFQRADAAPPSEQQINGRSPSGLESRTATAAACCTDELNKGLLHAQPRVDPSKLPFDPKEFIKKLPGWDNIDD